MTLSHCHKSQEGVIWGGCVWPEFHFRWKCVSFPRCFLPWDSGFYFPSFKSLLHSRWNINFQLRPIEGIRRHWAEWASTQVNHYLPPFSASVQSPLPSISLVQTVSLDILALAYYCSQIQLRRVQKVFPQVKKKTVYPNFTFYCTSSNDWVWTVEAARKPVSVLKELFLDNPKSLNNWVSTVEAPWEPVSVLEELFWQS